MSHTNSTNFFILHAEIHLIQPHWQLRHQTSVLIMLTFYLIIIIIHRFYYDTELSSLNHYHFKMNNNFNVFTSDIHLHPGHIF